MHIIFQLLDQEVCSNRKVTNVSVCADALSESGECTRPAGHQKKQALTGCRSSYPGAGDCCAATCVPMDWYTCDSGDEHCVDPDHATPSPWEGCDFGNGGWLTDVHLNDSWCHTELNTQLCGFDGGASFLRSPSTFIWHLYVHQPAKYGMFSPGFAPNLL